MKQVTKDEFYAFFGQMTGVSTGVVGNYPYTWEVKRHGNLIAKSVDSYETEYEWPVKTEYFINETYKQGTDIKP